jgi:hypothetical protein
MTRIKQNCAEGDSPIFPSSHASVEFDRSEKLGQSPGAFLCAAAFAAVRSFDDGSQAAEAAGWVDERTAGVTTHWGREGVGIGECFAAGAGGDLCDGGAADAAEPGDLSLREVADGQEALDFDDFGGGEHGGCTKGTVWRVWIMYLCTLTLAQWASVEKSTRNSGIYHCTRPSVTMRGMHWIDVAIPALGGICLVTIPHVFIKPSGNIEADASKLRLFRRIGFVLLGVSALYLLAVAIAR